MVLCFKKLIGLSVRTSIRSMSVEQRHVLSGNLTLIPTTPVKLKKTKTTWIVEFDKPRPLLILFQYMNAKTKHIDKFVEFYNERNFDVLTSTLTPWQLFFPIKGSQVVALDVAEFLLANERYSPLVYHGLSVGGYLWGEVMQHCVAKHPRFLPVTDRIRGQILDSGVDVAEIPTAFPNAVFPQKPKIRSLFERLIRFQMNIFYEESTKHYIAARKAFTNGSVKGPTLLIFSDSDPLSTLPINKRVEQDLLAVDRTAILKQFHGSTHVMHYQKHKEEYLETIEKFLQQLDLDPPTSNVKEENNNFQSKL